jgi:NAD(P)-dependent dehydrogenase (short-subunit alcohol dehydrogenase family)/acyl carrier protein
MERLLTSAERRFGINRYAMAAQTVFMSHETYTPARGGSAAAEVTALRQCLGRAADEIVVANTKGFTGHPMGAGVEDVIAVKILEHGIVPPVPNFRDPDPELGALNLSRGGRYPVQYALRLAAGFGSQISMTLVRKVPGGPNRVDDPHRYGRWLANVSGHDRPELEIEKRVLRIKADGAPQRLPAGSEWQYGTGPMVRAAGPGDSAGVFQPMKMAAVRRAVLVAPQQVAAPEVAEVRRSETAAPAVPTRDVVSPAAAPEISPAPARVAAPEPAPQTAPEPAPMAQTTPTETATDAVTAKVLAVVAANTGYPEDMLDLELDLEADLGIDTVKQAETLAAIREAFGIPFQENLSLRDYPTLQSVVGFVYQFRPDLAAGSLNHGGAPESGDAERGGREVAARSATSVASAVDPVTAKVLEVVAAKTGYPEDMLDLELDLEADLGIDTVKQAETFAAIREAFGIPFQENLSLRDYPTLQSVVGFVYKFRPDLFAGRLDHEGAQESGDAEREGREAAAPSATSVASAVDSVTAKVLEVVAAKTGYPQDMLDLELDLEADLGIDTVKQAETFAAIREAFSIPFQENLSLRDYPTLQSVVGFVYRFRPDLQPENGRREEVSTVPFEVSARATSEGAETRPLQEPAKEAAPAYRLEDADRIPRRVPVPVLRPSVDLCVRTGVTLEGARIVVMRDEGDASVALEARLREKGATALALEAGIDGPELLARLGEWLAQGPIAGVYWLPALDAEPALAEVDLSGWREINRRRVKNLYATMRALYSAAGGSGPFLVSATRLGGLHGYGAGGAAAPAGGGVTGFTKAYAMEQALRGGAERTQVTVKAVDFETHAPADEVARRLIDETLLDPGVIEAGYRDGLRWSIGLEERSSQQGAPGLQLGPGTVFLVTGAAGGITSAIVVDLAAASHGVFYLLDLAPAPARDDAHIALFRQGRETLKAALIAEAKARKEKITPAAVDKQIASVERADAALRAIEAVEACGGTAHYHSLDLRDGDAVRHVVDDARQRYGRIDVLIHAGGVLIDRTLPNKEPAQFDLVFDVKVDGWFNLLSAAGDMPIAATVAFSSVAGRFGNNGQTDYSAANDLLCKLTANLSRTRPGTRGIAIDWTAWGGIGMASRGSVPQVMQALGVDMLPPESGVPTVRRELVSGNRSGEIVVAGRLGAWLEERHPTGGLDAEAAIAYLATRQPGLPLVGKITSYKLHGGIEIETTLDPKEQPFLYDHAPDPETPWLPGVMATEAMAEAALALAPGYRVVAVENVAMMGALKFFRMEPRTLRINAVVTAGREGELLVRTTLRSVQQPAKAGLPVQIKEHFTAQVRLAKDAPSVDKVTFEAPAQNKLNTCGDDIYKVFFHGPAYQVLECARAEPNEAVGVLPKELPAELAHREPNGKNVLMAPRLIESLFQAAAFWNIKQKGAMAFPLGIGSVTTYRPLESAGDKRLYAVVITPDEGQTFDGRVVDDEGEVYVELRGYRTVSRPA